MTTRVCGRREKVRSGIRMGVRELTMIDDDEGLRDDEGLIGSGGVDKGLMGCGGGVDEGLIGCGSGGFNTSIILYSLSKKQYDTSLILKDTTNNLRHYLTNL